MYIENTLQNSLNSSYLMLQRKNSITSCCISSKPNCINLNTMVAEKLKLSNGFKKQQKIYTKQSIMSIAYTKSFEVEPQFNHQSDSKS